MWSKSKNIKGINYSTSVILFKERCCIFFVCFWLFLPVFFSSSFSFFYTTWMWEIVVHYENRKKYSEKSFYNIKICIFKVFLYLLLLLLLLFISLLFEKKITSTIYSTNCHYITLLFLLLLLLMMFFLEIPKLRN